MFVFGALVGASHAALAQEAAPPDLPPPAPAPGTPVAPPPVVTTAPPAAGAPAPEPPRSDDGPPAHTGFQLAIRTGVAIPFGKLEDAKNGAMSDTFSPQVPFVLDIGGKP